MSLGHYIYWDACCKRWRKDLDGGSWVMDEHEYQEFNMEDCEVYGKTVTTTTDLSGKYVLWSPESLQAPRVVYDNKGDAIKAAYAMVNKNPGARFTVCKIEGVAALKTVEFVDFEKSTAKVRK